MTKKVARASKRLQDLEHPRRVNRVRPVIDREPDFAFRRFEMGHDRPPPLAVRDQGREQNQHVGKKKNPEREERMKRDDREKKTAANERKAKNQSYGFMPEFQDDDGEEIANQEPEPENA